MKTTQDYTSPEVLFIRLNGMHSILSASTELFNYDDTLDPWDDEQNN